MLYLVGTPIGNMGDISRRAEEVLAQADIIACEDTRRTGLLLAHIGVEGKLSAYHEHNKASKGPILIEKMKAGATVALVSDAGMPSINDPGEDLVKLCIENDIDISVVPGPVAAITALVMSGLDTTHFHYEGFLPSEQSERKKRIEEIKKINETIIIYEAPHRLTKLLAELVSAGFGESRAALCREMTKKYEQVLRMTISEASEYYSSNTPKGEFVICLEPVRSEDKPDYSEKEIDAMIRSLAESGMSTKEIAAEVASVTGRRKKEIYEHTVAMLK